MNLTIKIPQKAWCINPQYKAEEVYVKSFGIDNYEQNFETDCNIDLSNKITYVVDRYNDGKNSYVFTVRANRCFKTKQELLNSL